MMKKMGSEKTLTVILSVSNRLQQAVYSVSCVADGRKTAGRIMRGTNVCDRAC
jgi:hypothetical protein